MYRTQRYTSGISGATLALKREDLNHTGAHKINNTVGQALLARRMGKKRIIAETGAGQHGVATATVGAKFGIPVDVYMGALDVERQALNVYIMKLLGATVHPVTGGTQTLKDATNEAFRQWAARVDDTFYVIGSVVGAHPVSVHGARISKSDRRRSAPPVPGAIRTTAERRRLRASAAAVMPWAFSPRFSTITTCACGVWKPRVKVWKADGPRPRSRRGTVGVLHGSRSYLLQTAQGQVVETHSISAGLDYPGVGPEHAHLKESGRATYVPVTDREALDAFYDSRAPKASSPRWKARTRSRLPGNSPPSVTPTISSS